MKTYRTAVFGERDVEDAVHRKYGSKKEPPVLGGSKHYTMIYSLSPVTVRVEEK